MIIFSKWHCGQCSRNIIGDEQSTYCVWCLNQEVIKLRERNIKLVNACRNERQLRGSAQRKIGKLLTSRKAMDIWVDGLQKVLEKGLKAMEAELEKP